MHHDDGAKMTGGGAMGGPMNMKDMLERLPKGRTSPSGHYWCAMCKKMFELEEPVCPYMPSMCVNTPIPVETVPPGSTAFYERFGLFYPKLVQKVLAAAVRRAAHPEAVGAAFADDFLADLEAWDVQWRASPLEAVKAFLVYTSGFDAALRTTEEGVTFFVMDAGSVWGEEMPLKKRSKAALLAGVSRVGEALGLEGPFDLHFMSMTSGKLGRYYCAQCTMFFEFGQPQAQVTCPFMPQKCKFRPKPLSELQKEKDGPIFDLDLVTKVFAVSPKLYRRQLSTALAAEAEGEDGAHAVEPAEARRILVEDLASWGFDTADREGLEALLARLGLASEAAKV